MLSLLVAPIKAEAVLAGYNLSTVRRREHVSQAQTQAGQASKDRLGRLEEGGKITATMHSARAKSKPYTSAQLEVNMTYL